MRREGGQAGRRAGGQGAPIMSGIRNLLTALRRVCGMPDYAAYVAHLRERHPDRPVPSEREYYQEFVNARYAGGTSRCC